MLSKAENMKHHNSNLIFLVKFLKKNLRLAVSRIVFGHRIALTN